MGPLMLSSGLGSEPAILSLKYPARPPSLSWPHLSQPRASGWIPGTSPAPNQCSQGSLRLGPAQASASSQLS